MLHEPFRKTLRQNQLRFTPSTAAALASPPSMVASPAGAAAVPALSDAVMGDDAIEGDDDEVLELA